MDSNEKKYLRNEYMRFSQLNSVENCKEAINIFAEFFILAIDKHFKKKDIKIADFEAQIFFQMVLSKLLHLDKFLEGIEFKSLKGIKLNKIYDPTILASLVRNIFETVSLFNLIWINTESSDEKEILHSVWVVSGLKYRQRFTVNAILPESIAKGKVESKEIDQLKERIKNNPLFKSLEPKEQKFLLERLKKKDFQIRFENNQVKKLSWQEMGDLLGLNTTIFNNIYTHLSLHAHPSNVSVFQFQNMYEKDDEAFRQLAITNIKYGLVLVSVFVSDYIKLFPEVLKTFETLPIRDQLVINAFNKLFRGNDHSINETWKLLE